MNLKFKAKLLCESLVRNTSLISVHLSYNYLDKTTIGEIKWFLSIGIEVEPKGMPVYKLPFESEPEEPIPIEEEKPKKTEKQKAKKKKAKPAKLDDLEAVLKNL